MPPNLTHAPTFYLTARQPLRPSAILLAIIAAVAALALILAGMAHAAHRRLASNPDRSSNSAASSAEDDNDDPNQIDTIVLGDPADAPSPGKKGDHVSPVHPTIIVRLPRFGDPRFEDQIGLIPATDAGRLLYAWLAAFNQSSSYALSAALPNVAPGPAAAAQLQLRQQTGGFNLISAREVQPGILVFRLRDQTPQGGESLGTLQVAVNAIPAAIATFSLRAVPPSRDTSEPRNSP